MAPQRWEEKLFGDGSAVVWGPTVSVRSPVCMSFSCTKKVLSARILVLALSPVTFRGLTPSSVLGSPSLCATLDTE